MTFKVLLLYSCVNFVTAKNNTASADKMYKKIQSEHKQQQQEKIQNSKDEDMYSLKNIFKATAFNALNTGVQMLTILLIMMISQRYFSIFSTESMMPGARNFLTYVPTVDLRDVRGHEKVKRILISIVDIFKKEDQEILSPAEKEKQAYLRKILVPNVILLAGPPGTGKTTLVEALANYAGVPFIKVCGSDFQTGFVGSGSYNLRALFAQAFSFPKCILFIDEIDEIVKDRNRISQDDGTVQQFMYLIDEARKNPNKIMVFCATNRTNAMDQASLRRFKTQHILGNPTSEERFDLLKHLINKAACYEDISDDNLQNIVALTEHFSSANLEKLLENAIIDMAHERKAKTITYENLLSVTHAMIKSMQDTQTDFLSSQFNTSTPIAHTALNIISPELIRMVFNPQHSAVQSDS